MKLVKTLLTPPVCAISFVCAFALSVRAADLYVSTNGLHSIDGVVWGWYMTDDGVVHNAYTNLQQAVNAAAKGDSVWVEDGFVCDDSQGYTVVSGAGTANEVRVRLSIPRAITLRSRSGKWETGAVIEGKWHLDADPASDKPTGIHSVRGIEANGSTVIGFTIRRASCNGYGALAFNNGTISNCYVTGSYGGYLGISTATIRHCVISNCTATTYAGICRYSNVYDSLIIDNGHGYNGARVSDSGQITLDEIGKGGHYVVSNCTFVGNCGGTIVTSVVMEDKEVPEVVDCTFIGNTTGCASSNGKNGSITVRRCIFRENSGACLAPAYNGVNYVSNHVRAYDCVMTNNTGCVASYGSELYNCLVSSNACSSTLLDNGKDLTVPLLICNSTIVGNYSINSGLSGGRVIALNSIVADTTYRLSSLHDSFAAATNSCLMATAVVAAGEGNTTESPDLVDPANGLFSPSEKSPCLGTGSLTAYPLPEKDLAGRPRTVDGKVSIGAYEYDPANRRTRLTADFPAMLYAPAFVTLRADVAGYGTEPMFYWDLDGDGRTDRVTSVPTFKSVFDVGTWTVGLVVSNLAQRTGGGVVLEPFTIAERPVRYVKDGNPDAAEPYDTEENAAADIQTAIDFANPGDKVVILPGTYSVMEGVKVLKNLILCGSTGRPEDVVIDGNCKCRTLLVNGDAETIVHSLTVERGWVDGSAGRYGATASICGAEKGTAAGAGIVSNVIVRGGYITSKLDCVPGIFASGPRALVTHCVITNNSSKACYTDGGCGQGLGLHVTGGARAENCLVANNRSESCATSADVWTGYYNGHFQAAALVGDKSVIRFCTVVNNRCGYCGGINVADSGRFEACVIAGNTVLTKNVAEQADGARYAVWSAFPEGSIQYNGSYYRFYTPDSDAGKNCFYGLMDEEHARATNLAMQNTTNAVDVAETGLGAGTIVATPEQFFRNAAKRDWRLRPSSPARDIVEPADAGAMASGDLLGNPRLSNGLYDLGCFEAVFRGFGIFVR